MIKWPKINEISSLSGISSNETEQILLLFDTMQKSYRNDISFSSAIFNDKAAALPLHNYAKGQYMNGVRAVSIISAIKNIVNSVTELLKGQYANEIAQLRILIDLFEIQFINSILSEQTHMFNVKIDSLKNDGQRIEARFKSFIDSFRQIIFITDQFGNITDCNSSARKYFSIPQEQTYPKLLPLFDQNYLETEEFLHMYITRGRREIRLMNGEIFHIEVKNLQNSTSQTPNYLIILEEFSLENRPRLLKEPNTSFSKLTKTERLVCSLIYKGMRNKDISVFLSVSDDTVKNHRKAIRGKLMLNNQKINLYYFLRENFKPEN